MDIQQSSKFWKETACSSTRSHWDLLPRIPTLGNLQIDMTRSWLLSWIVYKGEKVFFEDGRRRLESDSEVQELIASTLEAFVAQIEREQDFFKHLKKDAKHRGSIQIKKFFSSLEEWEGSSRQGIWAKILADGPALLAKVHPIKSYQDGLKAVTNHTPSWLLPASGFPSFDLISEKIARRLLSTPSSTLSEVEEQSLTKAAHALLNRISAQEISLPKQGMDGQSYLTKLAETCQLLNLNDLDMTWLRDLHKLSDLNFLLKAHEEPNLNQAHISFIYQVLQIKNKNEINLPTLESLGRFIKNHIQQEKSEQHASTMELADIMSYLSQTYFGVKRGYDVNVGVIMTQILAYWIHHVNRSHWLEKGWYSRGQTTHEK